MRHLILCREFPPAVYPPGGIGTYVQHITRLLAEHGETVHVIGERWEGAPRRTEYQCDGRVVIHRISSEDRELYPSLVPGAAAEAEVAAMLRSDFLPQWFSWVAAGLVERLVAEQEIDVIEAQEWEAPLFYFLQRRALGLGPSRRPPCLVHLHSPTEFIFKENDWPLDRPDYQPQKRCEDYVIHAADGHLCPSEFLAAQASAHYGLTSPIEVIPLPLGDGREQHRDRQVWSGGDITFVGRLEPRKGIIEFVDAAIAVSRERPDLRFNFIGSDNRYNDRLSVHDLLSHRIPDAQKTAFRFQGGKPRAQVLALLGKARIAAVPSRWENFPNTCVEAMASGLPVLATRNGGMAEMIRDGESGWLAPDGSAPLSERIAEALLRAVDTPPERLAEMGAAAAAAIRETCDNRRITERHIAVRARAEAAGARQSRRLPKAYPWPEVPSPETPSAPAPPRPGRTGETCVAVVALRDCDPAAALSSLADQSRMPRVILVSNTDAAKDDCTHEHVHYAGTSRLGARNAAMAACPEAARWMFLEAGTTLASCALDRLGGALDAALEAGFAVGWAGIGTDIPGLFGPPPAFPYQWAVNEVDGPTLWRREALEAAGNSLEGIPHGHEDWALGAAVMAQGWPGVRVPARLAVKGAQDIAAEEGYGLRQHARLRIAARFPDLVGRDAVSLLSILGPRPGSSGIGTSGVVSGETSAPVKITSLRQVMAMPVREQLKVCGLALKRPDWAIRWLLWRIRTTTERIRNDDK